MSCQISESIGAPPTKYGVTFYPNGGQSTVYNGEFSHISYPNGDQIWLKICDNKYKVTAILTHDGIAIEC